MTDQLAAATLLIAMCVVALRPRYPIRATLTRDGVVDSKNLPPALHSHLARFSRDNVPPGESVRLWGHRTRAGRIRWIPSKNTAPEFIQRLRNFMANEVYR